MATAAVTIATIVADAERVATAVAPMLPGPLASVVDARFTRSDRLFDEFVSRLASRVVATTALAEAVRTWGTAEEIVERAGFDRHKAPVPVAWLLRRLEERNVIERHDEPGGPRFRGDRLQALDPTELLDAQQRHDPTALPSYTLAATAADGYPAFLAGKRSGEEILLAPARLALWNAYFANDNPLYAVNNRVGATALSEWLGPGPNVLLELGAGMGSGTSAAVTALRGAGRLHDVTAYRATDVVPIFLRYAERRVRAEAQEVPGLSYEKLDMNAPFAGAGVEPGTISIVYAVNTLHVAHDLAATLAEIRQALRPGGQLVISECVRPRQGQTLYPEFVFNMLATFRAPRLDPTSRPNGGFLTPEQWRAALEAAGFGRLRLLPDVTTLRDVVPYFSVAAIGATRVD